VVKPVMGSVSQIETLTVVLSLTTLRYASIKLATFKKGGFMVHFMANIFETLWAIIIGATATNLLA
jgi:hypothetical protein